MADLVAKLSDDLTCAICYEFYKTPKVLSCLHRYCRDCLHSYIVKCGGKNAIPCPKCRKLTLTPRPASKRKIQGVELADNFPTDFLLQEMVDTVKKQRTSDNCSKHPDHPIVLYCQDCECTICHVCAGVDHRKCDGVIPLTSEAKKKRNRLNADLKSLAEARTLSQSNEIKIEDRTKSLEKVYDQVNNMITEELKEIRQLVSSKELMCMCKLRIHTYKELSTLSHNKTKEKENQEDISKSEEKINDALENLEDIKLVQKKFDVVVPDVEVMGKRRIPSCEEVYDAVVKRFKLRETIAFLNQDFGKSN